MNHWTGILKNGADIYASVNSGYSNAEPSEEQYNCISPSSCALPPTPPLQLEVSSGHSTLFALWTFSLFALSFLSAPPFLLARCLSARVGLWPLNITQAVSAEPRMSPDTYSAWTPCGISICTEPISIFIAARWELGPRPQSERAKVGDTETNVCVCACTHARVFVCMFVVVFTQACRLPELTFFLVMVFNPSNVPMFF